MPDTLEVATADLQELFVAYNQLKQENSDEIPENLEENPTISRIIESLQEKYPDANHF